MKTYAFRIKPGEDLRSSLVDFATKDQLKAGFVLTCVGSLNCATLRMADTLEVKTFNEKFEIVSMEGTFSTKGCHIHVSLSKKDSSVIGGHLKEGCTIHTTAEIVIGENEELIFSRENDESTGFEELLVKQRSTE